jgi:hypothetical protein
MVGSYQAYFNVAVIDVADDAGGGGEERRVETWSNRTWR